MDNNRTYAPTVLFVYNRLEHTKKLIESIDRLPEACYTDLYIFSDASKNDMAVDDVNSVRHYIDDYASKSNFKNVEIYKSPINKGLANSIISGVSMIIERYGKVIVLEDDLVVSPDFFQFMNTALDYYENEKTIWAISGYTFPLNAFENYYHDVYVSGRGCSWGWATWKDRWVTVDWDVKDYPHFKFNQKKRHEFASWGKDLPCMLDACMFHEINSWAIRWCYAAFVQNKLTIYPVESRIINNGTDGSGTNFESVEKRYDTYLTENAKPCNFENVKENKDIRREFSSKYITGSEKYKLYLRWTLIKLGLLKPHIK